MKNVINALYANNAALAMQSWCSETIENANTDTFDADYVGDAVLSVIGINNTNDAEYVAGYENLMPVAAAALNALIKGHHATAEGLANEIFNKLA